MSNGEALIELPADNVVTIVAAPDTVNRVPETNKIASNTSKPSVGLAVVQSYAKEHVTSMNKLAAAFSEYMSDLTTLQDSVFLTSTIETEE